VRADANQLTALVAQVDAGTVRVKPAAVYPLVETAKVHEQHAAGSLHGKVVLAAVVNGEAG
jgi:NADPH:quinone reductase-like Zn-dependent oxidoreductase